MGYTKLELHTKDHAPYEYVEHFYELAPTTLADATIAVVPGDEDDGGLGVGPLDEGLLTPEGLAEACKGADYFVRFTVPEHNTTAPYAKFGSLYVYPLHGLTVGPIVKEIGARAEIHRLAREEARRKELAQQERIAQRANFYRTFQENVVEPYLREVRQGSRGDYWKDYKMTIRHSEYNEALAKEVATLYGLRVHSMSLPTVDSWVGVTFRAPLPEPLTGT